jgi:5S rRNA maturation endonuclease (ribonuclease M5)
MNQKARKLSEQLIKRETIRENLIKSQKKQLEDFDNETKRINDRLNMTLANCNPQIKAAKAWCRITNALIRKYKHLTEQDPNRALKELTRIEGALLAGGFLTEQELEEAL